ncbi:MAG: GNAT family N-acetyltransferase [Pararobbsia sp.]
MIVDKGDDWSAFHDIQRTALFNQAADDYRPEFHDHNFHRPAERFKLLLKWNGKAMGITTLDVFADGKAATRAVAIAETMQGQGHGRALGELVQQFARTHGTKVLCVNSGSDAVGFYRSLGFVTEIWDPREYDGITEPESMIQMTRQLL